MEKTIFEKIVRNIVIVFGTSQITSQGFVGAIINEGVPIFAPSITHTKRDDYIYSTNLSIHCS